jgi:hypothetical protein
MRRRDSSDAATTGRRDVDEHEREQLQVAAAAMVARFRGLGEEDRSYISDFTSCELEMRKLRLKCK